MKKQIKALGVKDKYITYSVYDELETVIDEAMTDQQTRLGSVSGVGVVEAIAEAVREWYAAQGVKTA